jgi:TolB-like protein
MSDIFLSYSRADQDTAKRFADGLERAGFSVWWDQNLNPGEAFDKVTEKALEEARAVVVLWSKQSVDSRWVRAEATQANTNGTLVPVMIEACKRPIMFELTHTVDLTHWRGDPNDKTWLAFVAGVRRVVEKGAPAAADATAAAASIRASTPAGSGRGPHMGGRLIAIAVAALVLAGAGLWLFNRKSIDPVAPPTSATAVPVPGLVTLAVLPFADLSAAHDQEYFSDGLTEELLNQLAQIRDLRVTARTSSFSFKGKNEDVRVIGEQLGVANLLEGSVRKDGPHLRITAQLVNGKDGSHLWSQTYDRELKDVFAVQEAIAKDVAIALSIRLDVGAMSRARGGTTDLEAYDKYLQARALLHQFGAVESQRASALYREALTIDPDFALAWHGLYTALGYSLVADPRKSSAARKEMEQATVHLAALTPDAWWTRAAHADQFMLNRKWAEAEKAADETVARTSDVDALALHAAFLICVGRANEAVQDLQQARRADPLSLRISGLLQLYLDVAGRPEEAQVEFERSKGLAGDHGRPDWAAFLRLWRRSDADPAAVRAAFRVTQGPNPSPFSRELMGALEKPDVALAAIRRALDEASTTNYAPLTAISFYADHYGDEQLALTAMQRAFLDFNKVNYEGLWWPRHSSLRADPRFKDLLRSLGLVDYFRASGNWGDFCAPTGAEDFECH